MSMDNGYVIRSHGEGFVLQMYFASADDYPPITEKDKVYPTMLEAVVEFLRLDAEARSDGFMLSEYGLSFAETPSRGIDDRD